MSAKEDAMDSVDNNDDGAVSLAQGRSRRQKVDKKGRLSAFEKLRLAKEKGVKNKYEVTEEQNVYDVVEEEEYSDLVRQRQDDDWIVDDDGGYVEDGREIFDDEMDESAPARPGQKNREEKKKNKNIVRPGTKPKQDIKSMFAAAAVSSKRKPEKEASLADDDILDSLMGEITGAPSSASKATSSVTTKAAKKPAYNPFKKEARPSTSKPSPIPVQKPIKRELSYPGKSQKGQTKTSFKKPEDDWSKVKVKEERMDFDDECSDLPAPVADDDVEIKQEKDDDGQEDLSGIDFDDGGDFDEPEAEVKTEEKPALISEDVLNIGWENVGDAATVSGGDATSAPTPSDLSVDGSDLPLVTGESGEQVLRFYWLDAFEDAFRHPGVVYLFGKVYVDRVKAFVSCCVTVKNIERRMFVLPRVKRVNVKTGQELSEEITLPMVYEEISRVAEKYKIDNFRSMKVTKKYAFEKLDVPVEADYLEVRFPADLPGNPTLPSDLQGETFSHVFGTKTSSLELLLLNRKMKGPAWLDLKCPQVPSAAYSWCKLEAIISKPEHISVCSSATQSPPPPLTVMSLNLQTLPNPKTKQNEIVAASCLIHSAFHMDKPAPKQAFQQHFCVITKPTDCVFPYDFKDQVKKQSKRFTVDIMPNERSLIAFLLAKIHRFDPDLLVGHDIAAFDLDVLLHRISANKIPHWSKISRLKRTVMPKLGFGQGRATLADRSAVCGRILCDVQVSAKELIRCRSYDLTVLAADVLKVTRTEVDYDEIKAMFQSSKQLLNLIELTLMDSNYILRIMYELNVLPLALQITSICGNVMSRTLMGGRSERNEWLLLHAFHEKSYLCPDKEFKKKVVAPVNEDDEELDQTGGKKAAQSGKRKPAYSGGLVLEPKKGFYDTFILLLDFNSLYPSIIQEYNICFTTISRAESAQQTGEDEEGEANLILPDQDLEPGVLPVEIRKLVDSRKQVKSLMKRSDVTPDQMLQYDIRQKALKLTANSMYGCLGFSFSRFYARPLAALVTGKGREILLKTKDLVQGMNLDVIYGDTDSIMINTNSTDLDTVFKLGNKVKSEVNKLYRLLEIDIDGVFKSMLLLKKKKYAALTISRAPDGTIKEAEERKGLDIVRRDWCDLAKEAGSFVVTTILSGKSREATLEEIHSRLEQVGEEVREGKLPLDLFHITKQLTKNPEDYPDKKSLPHVQVALRFNSKGGKKMRAGDTVPYLICEDGSSLSATQRAYHPEELAKQDNLKLDTKYYLAHQVHPVVSRLCDPIEGTDSARIAECLGLDPSGYRQAARAAEGDEEEDVVTLQLTMEERFRDCHRFNVTCPAQNCGRIVVLDAPFVGNDTNLSPALLCCPNQDCKYPLWQGKARLKNMLQRTIQAHVNKYYQGWLKCEDAACGTRTNRLPLVMQRGHPVCGACNRGYLHQEYSDSALYTQLCFYEHIFDIPKASTYLNDIEKGVARKVNVEVSEVYRELKLVVTKWLDRSAYSNVDLGKLFISLGLASAHLGQGQAKVKVEREI